MSRAELGLGISHEIRYVLKSRLLSKLVASRARMPTSKGVEPPPVPPNWPPPVKGENEPPPLAGGARGGAGSGVPSKGWSSWVPAAEGSVRLPVRVPKTSAVALATLATLAAALWTVPTALAAVVPTLDGRRNAPPTEAGTVGTGVEGVEGVKPVTA